MRTPVWSNEMPSGAIRFGYPDGSTQYAPPTEYTRELNASLPDSLDGATAGADLESLARKAIAGGGQSPAPPPSMADFGGGLTVPTGPSAPKAGEISTAPAPTTQPEVVAGAIDALRAGAPSQPGGRFTTAHDRDLAAAMTARGYGLSMQPNSPPATYAPNPNEGRQPPPAPPRPQVIRTPGGWVPTSRQYQFRETPEAAEEGMHSALDAGNQAAQLREMAGNEAAERKLQYDIANAQALKYEEDQQAKRDAARQQRAEAELAKIRREVDDVGKMRINPDAYWDSKSTAQKVTLALALGVTSALGMPGLQKMVDGEIARNIDAQKTNKGIADKAVEGKVNVYQEMLKRFGDEKSAEMAATAMYQRQIARQAEINAQRAAQSDPAKAARSLEIKAAYDRAAAAIEDQLHGRNVAAGEAYQPPRTMVVGGAARKPDKGGAKEYGKARATYGLDGATERYAEMEGMLRKYKPGESVPGLTATDRWIAETLGMAALEAKGGKEAVANYQTGMRFLDGTARVRSGAALPPSELNTFGREFFGDGDADSIRRGANGVQDETRARDQGLQRAFGQDAVGTYWGNPTVYAPDETPEAEIK